jgi:anti-sigma factor RsiW
MSACDDKALLLNALVDGELDAANTVALEAHLKTCPGCTAALAELQAVRQALSAPGVAYAAPEAFRRRLNIALAAEAQPQRKPRATGGAWTAWFGGGALAAAGVAALLFVGVQGPTLALQDELVGDHVRSLLATHLMDVETSDRHTVKPWFDGKVAFAPTVIDFADKGFPLAGGRLDWARGQRAAAIVYRRRLHVINVFVLPTAAAGGLARDGSRNGYNLVHWTGGGLTYWAVSDLDHNELAEFRDLYLAALKS